MENTEQNPKNSQETNNENTQDTNTNATKTPNTKDSPIIKPRNSQNAQITPSQNSIRLKILKITLFIGFIANFIGLLIAFVLTKFNLYNPLTFYQSLNLEFQIFTWCIYITLWIALLKIIKSISIQYN